MLRNVGLYVQSRSHLAVHCTGEITNTQCFAVCIDKQKGVGRMCTIHKIKSEADQYRSPRKREEEGTVVEVYKVWLFLETKLGQSDAV